MPGLTDNLWRLAHGIVSLGTFIVTCLLVLGLIFSPDIRFNLASIYYKFSSSGIVGIYVFILLVYSVFLGVTGVLLALYNAGGINRNLIKQITKSKTKSRFEIWISKVIYIFFPTAIFLYLMFLIT